MKLKNWKLKLAILASLGLLITSATVPNAFAFTESVSQYSEDRMSIDIKQINEVAKTTFIDGDNRDIPTQNLAQLVAMIVKLDTASEGTPENYSGTDVLKYLYPKDTDDQLKSETITAQQALLWLNSVGYSADLINRALTTDEIKNNLDNAQPMVTVLQGQNDADWLYRNYCGILYAHDDVEAGTEKLHESFIKTINSGEATLQDGAEAQAFEFPNLKENPDAIHRATKYKWTQTLTNFKRDPNWKNGQTIRPDREKGIFTANLTKEGNNIVQADFTDPDVINLRGSMSNHPATESTTKLDAVALINLYIDADHQKTVNDLDTFAKISEDTPITSKQIEDWYSSLDFDYDTSTGKVTKDLTKKIGSEGKLYLTVMNAAKSDTPRENEAIIGAGFADNTEGYTPNWVNVKAEQINPQYIVDPSRSDAMQILHDKEVKFDYDTILRDGFSGSTYFSYDYNAETTLYNIRKKGTSVGTTSSFTKSNSTDLNQISDENNIKTSYTTAPDFNVRETQGTEPWCSEYVAAAEINTLDKANEAGHPITSAKQIMQELYPGVPDEELVKKSGPTIAETLKDYQTKYQVTADVEDRALSFDEVKKEIDNGQVIQLDAENLTAKDPKGKDENTGHSMAIVGYVSDSNLSHTPYYEIWNPWWKKTFYVSSKSSTIQLAGQEYKWNRTWHNWRKTSTSATLNLRSDIGKQRVASTINPSAGPFYNQEATNSPMNKDIEMQNVYQFGQPETLLDIFKSGVNYWYAYSLDNSRIQVGMNIAMTFGDNRQNNGVGHFVTDFNILSKQQLKLIKSGCGALAGAQITLLFTVVKIPYISKEVEKIIKNIFAVVGIPISVTDFVSDARAYLKYVDNINKDFVEALNDSTRK